MDKYIKMLLVKLSPHYKITVITTMWYNDDRQQFSNKIKLNAVNKTTKEKTTTTCNGKRELVQALLELDK